jgi:hypothetical protein
MYCLLCSSVRCMQAAAAWLEARAVPQAKAGPILPPASPPLPPSQN